MIFSTDVSREVAAALIVMAMIAVIVGADLSFFRGRTWFWERLAVNFGFVLVFGAFYFRFLGRQ